MISDNTRYIGLISIIGIVLLFFLIVVIIVALAIIKHETKENYKDEKNTIHKLKMILKLLLILFVFLILINTIWSWQHPQIGKSIR